MRRPAVTIRIQRRRQVEPRVIGLTRPELRGLAALALVLAAAGLAIALSWGSLARRAAMATETARELEAMRARSDSIELFVRRLAGLEAQEKRMRGLFGGADADGTAMWLPGSADSSEGAEPLSPGDARTAPGTWPLTQPGFVTQSLLEGDEGDHPGIDIAVPTGSYVVASGGGEVVEAGLDPVYGLFVLLDHGDGYRSLYGHASFLAVERGHRVRAGDVIALSGSTGASTAPHLHFEVLRHGEPVDPLSMVSPP